MMSTSLVVLLLWALLTLTTSVSLAQSVDSAAAAAAAADASCSATLQDPDESSTSSLNDDGQQPPPAVALLFTCPDSSLADNKADEYYLEQSDDIIQQLQDFRTIHRYDGRYQSYNRNKANTAWFKTRYFSEVVQDGDLIYESACGVGFNLLMTLETLYEEQGVSNLTVYGNDYEANSVLVANKLLDQEAQPWFHKGRICRGDSTNLSSFVPSDAFDLVYTGFVEPLLDPLNMLEDPMDDEAREALYMERLCEAEYLLSEEKDEEYEDDKDDDEQAEERELTQEERATLEQDLILLQKARRIQADWVASWVTEMLRIVKPGKFVIVEDLDYDMCHEDVDWAGVDMSWWEGAIEEYGWDVEPDSLLIVDKPWYGNRYNVRMRRRDPEGKPFVFHKRPVSDDDEDDEEKEEEEDDDDDRVLETSQKEQEGHAATAW